MSTCPHCGFIHETTCPRIRSIEYHPDGAVKRIEFQPLQPLHVGPPADIRFGSPTHDR